MSARADPIDRRIGRRLRERRMVIGMSQERLGELLGVTFQQIQKYERGSNRIGSSRLYQLSRVLEVPVTFFFAEAPAAEARAGDAARPGLAESDAAFDRAGAPGFEPEAETALPGHRDVLELVRAYQRIQDPTVRRRVGELVRALATLSYRDDAAGPGDA